MSLHPDVKKYYLFRALLKRFVVPILVLYGLDRGGIFFERFFGMGLIEDPWWLLGPLVIGSLAWVGLEIAVNDYINQSTQTGSRATLLSMSNFVRNLVGVLTIVLYGFVAQPTSAAYGYLVLGSVVAVVLIIPLVQLFRYQKV